MRLITKLLLITLTLTAVAVWGEVAGGPEAQGTRVFFFDVGQGDAALIQQGDIQILIDGGPDDKILSRLAEVMPATDRTLEYLVLSHPHADHVAGINYVLDRYQVGEVYFSGVTHTSSIYLDFLIRLKDKDISVRVPERGEKTEPFEGGTLTFLWPGDQYKGQETDNLNDSSIIARFCHLDFCALFPGDAEKAAQSAMLEHYQNDDVSLVKNAIIKVPHHGASNALLPELYEKSEPQFAVISAGKENRYNHPHPSVLTALGNFGVETYRTDEAGTVTFLFTENGIAYVR